MLMLSSLQNPSFILHAPGKTTIEDRPLPCIQDPHDVLINISSTGICGSDSHYYNHGRIGSYVVRSLMVLGHESSGIVTAVGSMVTRVKIGDRVALEPGIPCRYCHYCRGGRYNLCRKMQFAATPPYDGTLCGTYRLPEDFCHVLPSSLSMDEGAMAEPLAVAVHVMLKQAKVRLGCQVVIFGAGPIGLLCCAVARAYNASKIVAVDVNRSRLDFAKSYAATDIFDATSLDNRESTEANAERLRSSVGVREEGVDIAIDASGVESSIRLGIHLVRPGGIFVQAGMGKDDVSFPIAAICGKELDVKGSFRYGPGDYEAAIDLMAKGLVDVGRLITSIVPFEQAEAAFLAMKDMKEIKTVIRGPESPPAEFPERD